MKPMTLADLDEMERLEREATGAVWSLEKSNSKDSAGIYVEHEKLGIEIWNSLDAAKDANLIVAARNKLQQLLALARVGLLAVAEREAHLRYMSAEGCSCDADGCGCDEGRYWQEVQDAEVTMYAAIDAYKEGMPKP